MSSLEKTSPQEEYDSSEPWNGPNNSLPYARRINLHSGRSEVNIASTSCQIVMDSRTAWPGGRGQVIERIDDVADNTVLVVEIYDNGIH